MVSGSLGESENFGYLRRDMDPASHLYDCFDNQGTCILLIPRVNEPLLVFLNIMITGMSNLEDKY